jgi:hypothetical protein
VTSRHDLEGKGNLDMSPITVTARSIAEQLDQWQITGHDTAQVSHGFSGSVNEERSNATERTVNSFLGVMSRMPAAHDDEGAYTDEELGYE